MTILLYYKGNKNAVRKFDSTHTFIIKHGMIIIKKNDRVIVGYKVLEVWHPLLSDKTKNIQEIISKIVIEKESEIP